MPLANIATLRARVSTLVVACTVLLLALAALSAARACAAGSFAYEEAARFGGFDTSAYNGGHYGGALTGGKFVDPTGFAVDVHDPSAPDNTALYVVDRTSGLEGDHTSWRLQKLNDLGAVLGSTTFQLPNTPFDEQSGIAGLAVDDSGGGGRVYALVVGNDSSFTSFAYAKEVVAWSTTPNGSGALVAPEPLSADPLGSTGGLVSSSAQLAGTLSDEHALYDPQGIALDVTTGGAHDLAIEASDATGTGASGITSIPGVAGVWQVATVPQGGHATGDVLGNWSARSISSLPDAPAGEDEAAPYGISTNADGSLSVLLAEADGVPKSSNIDVVKLSADLGSPQLLLGASDVPVDQDRAAAYLSSPPGPFGGNYVAQAPWAAPGLVQLSSGLYAADIEHEAKTIDPYATSASDFYWRSAEATTTGVANVGVRLLLPDAGGEISDAKGGTVVNTLGYAKIVNDVAQAGGVCNLDAESESLAAGANGTLWVLGRGLDSSSSATTGTVGRQIVELTPGSGANACPQPTGGFTASAHEVSADTTVEYNADTVNLQNGSPFAYEWDLDNEGFKLVNELGLWPREENVEVLSWPPPTASFKYTKPGVYTVKLRVRSDYGTYETPSQTVTVTSAQTPVAKFAVSTATPTAEQPVIFNASESSAPSGATITNYHWEWGDGHSEDEQSSASFAHTYAAAGEYTVKLVVTDSNEVKSEVFSAKVTVAAPSTTTITSGGPTTTAPITTTTATTTTPPLETGPPSVSPKASAATNGIVKTTVSCPTTSQSCAGTVQVKTATAIAASAAKKSKKKPKKSQLVLGSTSFSLSGGGSQTLTIHLSSQGVALLNKSKSLRVLVIVTAHGISGGAKTETLALTLHAAPAKKSGHGKKH
jgi:PKD repeat protein